MRLLCFIRNQAFLLVIPDDADLFIKIGKDVPEILPLKVSDVIFFQMFYAELLERRRFVRPVIQQLLIHDHGRHAGIDFIQDLLQRFRCCLVPGCHDLRETCVDDGEINRKRKVCELIRVERDDISHALPVRSKLHKLAILPDRKRPARRLACRHIGIAYDRFDRPVVKIIPVHGARLEHQPHLRLIVDHKESANKEPPVKDSLLIILPLIRQCDVHGISGTLKESTRPVRKSLVIVALLRTWLVQACRYIDFFVREWNLSKSHVRHRLLLDYLKLSRLIGPFQDTISFQERKLVDVSFVNTRKNNSIRVRLIFIERL